MYYLCVIVNFCLTQVKDMGMHSPELISLVDNCPKGAETLITRVIHILTENGKLVNVSVLKSSDFCQEETNFRGISADVFST